MKVCSLSIDLDPIACYYAIHGLPEPAPSLGDVILRRGLPRFAVVGRTQRVDLYLGELFGQLFGNRDRAVGGAIFSEQNLGRETYLR